MPTSARMMSGGSAPILAIASLPSATVTTRMFSSANVSSITRRIVRLSSARSSVGGTSDLLHARPYVGLDEIDDVLHRATGKEDALHAHVAQLGDIDVGDDPAEHQQHVLESARLQQLHDARA